MSTSANRRAVTLVELLFAVLILAAFLVPAGSLFFQSSRLQKRSKQEGLAHLVSHRVMEKILALSQHGLKLVPVHANWHAIVPQQGLKLSPYFKDFSASSDGMRIVDFPVLSRDLKSFRLRVELNPVLNLENESRIRHALVTVEWPIDRGSGRSRHRLEALVSELLEI